MKKYELKQGHEELISTGGNYSNGLVLENALKTIPENFKTRRKDAISDRSIIASQVGLYCNARNDFNDINLYKNDFNFMNAFCLNKLPSEETLRIRMNELSNSNTHDILKNSNITLLKGKEFGKVNVDELWLTPVDIDVSPFDNSGSKKEGVSFTYKKHDGYAPIFAYIGTNGYMLNSELRIGKQHCQNGTPEFITQSVGFLKELKLNGECLIRLDSGNDSESNFDCFDNNKFIIKRNIRKESKEDWLKTAKELAIKESPRIGKDVYIADTYDKHPGNNENRPTVRVVFEIIERTIDKEGKVLLFPEIEVNTWWTNLNCKTKDVIKLYHDHGTSEQYHSELKSDMGIERLSSGKFLTNQTLLLCAMLSFNTLRTIGMYIIDNKDIAPVKVKTSRLRIKTVLQNIIYCAIRIINHAGKKSFSFGKNSPWFAMFRKMNEDYCS